MKLILCLVCFTFITSFSCAANRPKLREETPMATLALKNIPLMHGLKLTGEIEDVGQGGDICRIEAEASGNVFVEDIEEFYQDKLQTYGWERTGRFTYILNDKYLEIIPQNKEGMLTVIFQLKSRVL